MKNTLKLVALSLVIAVSFAACNGSAKKDGVDTTAKKDTVAKIDSTAKADTAKKDTTKK